MSRDTRPSDFSDKLSEYRERHKLASLGLRKPYLAPKTAPPALPSDPSDELATSIQASVTEIAVMWMLHKWSLTKEMRSEPLDQQITNFSAVAFSAIKARFPMLQDAKQEHLWLIYFKGLLTADTHPREQTIHAIKAIGARSWIRVSASPPGKPTIKPDSCIDAIVKPTHSNLSDSEALEQISRALGQTDINEV